MIAQRFVAAEVILPSKRTFNFGSKKGSAFPCLGSAAFGVSQVPFFRKFPQNLVWLLALGFAYKCSRYGKSRKVMFYHFSDFSFA